MAWVAESPGRQPARTRVKDAVPASGGGFRVPVTVVTALAGDGAQTRIMSTITTEITIGEVAVQSPGASRVFERLGLDYCCGGKRGFAAACQAKGLDPAAVLAEIDRENQPSSHAADRDWNVATLSELIDHIVSKHHGFMKTQMPRLDEMLCRIENKHGPKYGELLRPLGATFRALHEEISHHLMKEEMVLFPLVRGMEAGEAGPFHCGSVNNPIRVMTAEHDSAGDALETMRRLTHGYQPPADACTTFRAFYAGLEEVERDLHQHMHLENNILFPRAIALEGR